MTSCRLSYTVRCLAGNLDVHRKVVKRGAMAVAEAKVTEGRSEGRGTLSRERVIESAIAMADAGGIESLSMRRLAQDVGVEAMSLYHYFRSKNELQEHMLGAVYAE